MFFIVGSARSGTTLLRTILNAHSQVAVPPESRFIVELYNRTDTVRVEDFLRRLGGHGRWPAWSLPIDRVREELATATVPYAEAAEAPFKAFARDRGKTIYGDKTPRYIESIPLLVSLFPDARFIHMVRDGRDVALSYGHVPFGPKTVPRAAELWTRRVEAGLRDGRPLGSDRYVEMRYEDFVSEPEAQIKTICDAIGVSYEPEMLEDSARAHQEILERAAVYNPNVGKRPLRKVRSWAARMKEPHIEIFEAIGGDMLSELGYERRFPAPGGRARALAVLGRLGLPVARLAPPATRRP